MRNYLLSELSSHIAVSLHEINLDKILATGQVFRWLKHQDTWFGVIRNKVWVLRQDHSGIYYTTHLLHEDKESFDSLSSELADYFNLRYKLSDVTKAWTSGDPHLKSLLSAHAGLRLIKQDPYECLLAFITSSCNNMPRISSLMLKLSQLSKHSTSLSDTSFHMLPHISQFREKNAEQCLRDLGFGYRAKYIVSAMQDVELRGGVSWLEGLKDVELEVARKELSSLAGVGPKVAACVCLMALEKHEAVPIDTHIHQVAIKYYKHPSKSLTPALHNSIEQFFQSKHGKFAGWAQAYLFYSNSAKEKTKPSKNEKKKGHSKQETETKQSTNEKNREPKAKEIKSKYQLNGHVNKVQGSVAAGDVSENVEIGNKNSDLKPVTRSSKRKKIV